MEIKWTIRTPDDLRRAAKLLAARDGRTLWGWVSKTLFDVISARTQAMAPEVRQAFYAEVFPGQTPVSLQSDSSETKVIPSQTPVSLQSDQSQTEVLPKSDEVNLDEVEK